MAKLRNVLIAAISSLLLLGGGVAVYGTSQVHATEQQFVASGYILDGAEDRENGYAKLSFEAGTTYRTGYPDRVIFKDTAGIEVATDKTAFLHYSDGSLSALTDGVIVDLNNMSGGMLNNYRINAGTVLERRDSSYVIDSMSGTLYLDDFIWKISDTQYMLVSSTIDVAVGSQEPMYFNDAVELRYYNEGIMMLVTEAGAYRTVATDCAATVNSGITLDLASRTIVTDEEGTKMSMEQIILDADEVIDVLSPIMSAQKSDDLFERNQLNEAVKIAMPTFEVIDGEDGEDGEEGEDGEDGEMGEQGAIGQGGLTGADGLAGETGENGKGGLDGTAGADGAGGAPGTPGDPGTAGRSGVNGKNGQNGKAGAKGAAGAQGAQGRNGDAILEEEGLLGEVPEQVVLPVFSFKSFTISSDTVSAEIGYEDDKAYLDTDSIIVSVIRTADGKQVKRLTSQDYESTSSPFSVEFEGLLPEQEYTMQVSASYRVQNTEYTKVFVSKSFVTNSLGIEASLVYATEDKLAFMPEIQPYSTVESAKLRLIDPTDSNEPAKEVSVVFGTEIVFEGLKSNRAYQLQFTEIEFDNTFEEVPTYGTSTYYTLKTKPFIGNPEVIVNKVEGVFDMRLDSVKDEDNGIQYYRYEIYEVNGTSGAGSTIENNAVPVKEIYVSSNREVICPVAGEIQRGHTYRLRIVACFDDNEKMVEYTSIASGPFIMDGTGYPIVTFQRAENNYQHEIIDGQLIIDTNGASISASSGKPLRVQYTSSVGVVREKTYEDLSRLLNGEESTRYAVPFNVYGLKANDSYVLSVYGTLNLNDGQGEVDNALIGHVVVGTEPVPTLEVSIVEDTNNVTNAVAFKVGLKNHGTQDSDVGAHAAHTAQMMRINIYSGTAAGGTPIVTRDFQAVPAYDPANRTGGYYNTMYGGNTLTFTEAADSLSFNLNLLDEDQYTVEIALLRDYTEYANEITLINNTATFGKSAVRPDEDGFIAAPLTVVPISNAYAGNYSGGRYNSSLSPDSIVGYQLKTNYGQLTHNEAKVIYYAFEEARIEEKEDAQDFYSEYTVTNAKKMMFEKNISSNDTSIPEHIVWFGDEASGGKDMTRGSKYVFAVRIQMTDGSYFPSDNKKPAKTVSYPAPYEKPELDFVPWKIDPSRGTIEYRYIIKAGDAAAVGNEFVNVNDVGTISDDTKNVNKNKDNYSVLKLTDVLNGHVRVQCAVSRYNWLYGSEMQDVINYAVSAPIALSNLNSKLSYQFQHEATKNRVRIVVNDADSNGENLQKLAGLKLYVDTTNTGNTWGSPINVAWNSVNKNTADAYIYYSQLEDCKNHSCKIKLEAMFDTELAGYHLIENNSATVAIQAVAVEDGGSYITPNDSGSDFELEATGMAKDSWYTVNKGNLFENRWIGYEHALSSFDGTMQLSIESAGTKLSMSDGNYYVTLKNLTGIPVKFKKEDGTTSETADFIIDDMRPTINLNSGPVTYTIYPAADSARVEFILNGHKNLIEADKILSESGKYYIHFDLWAIDEYGNRGTAPIRLDCAKVEINGDIVKYENEEPEEPLITDLEVDHRYGITLYYLDKEGNKQYPLDIKRPDTQGDSIMFVFTTADEVKISYTPNSVRYNAVNYNDKSIIASLEFNTILGYDIAYELVKKEGEDYITLLNGEKLADLNAIYKTTSILTLAMDISLRVNPGQLHWQENGQDTKFTFGKRDDLFLKATPVSKQDDTKPLGKPCYIPLALEALTQPFYNFQVVPKTATSITVKVAVTDTDRVMVDNYYMIRIFNDNEDVTPEDVKAARYSAIGTKTFNIGNLTQGVTYRIKLYSILDMENAGGIDPIDTSQVIDSNCLKTVTANTLAGAFDFGQLTLANVSVDDLALDFTNSVGLQDYVKYVQYTVVNPNGSTSSYEWSADRDGGWQEDEDSLYFYLGHKFSASGTYTLQFRFLDQNRVSLDHDTTLTYKKRY